MTMSDYRIAAVTGASRGIGAATVRRLRRSGIEVHAVARDAKALDALARETGCLPHAVDVSDAAALRASIGGVPVDVLINNAAVGGKAGAAHELAAGAVDDLLAVNIRGVVNCLGLFAPGMIARNRGHIVNIGSVAGLHPLPGLPVYGATKAAIHSLSETLRIDLYGKRVRVSEICPARVKTYIHAQAVGGDRAKADEQFYRGYECLLPEDIADAIAFVLDAPARMDVTLMEVWPTDQVNGGGQFFRRD
jgi:NADP-dependent 3-hydroxy acid dehydrogenase YdfG